VAAVDIAMTETSLRKAVWLYDLRLAQLADGGYQLFVAETTADDKEPQLLSRDVIDERVASIDDALARLRQVLANTD
jgi:hypothetical protein